MRIISGKCRGKKLNTFYGKNIRPTGDRMREAIFNILSTRVVEAVVLDLFAGTGALGLEALSRGAASAVFIDNHPEAVLLLNKNINACGMIQETRVVKWDIDRNLNCLKEIQPGFNLIFLDPPYNRNLVEPALVHLHKSHALQPGAYIVIEHSLDELLPPDPFGFSLKDQRNYGKSLVSFFQYMV